MILDHPPHVLHVTVLDTLSLTDERPNVRTGLPYEVGLRVLAKRRTLGTGEGLEVRFPRDLIDFFL